MESLSSSTFLPAATIKPHPLSSRTKHKRCPCSMKVVSTFSYQNFVQFALDETKLLTPDLTPSYLQDDFSTLKAVDGKTELKMCSFQAPKIRLLRSLSIEQSDGMQVLDLAVFPEAEFDLPIFCANFFTSGNTNIVVLDLNPLHDVINETPYKQKYYRSLIPLGLKYAELLPWGGKLTGESLKFFSPIVIWTRFSSSHEKHDILFSAFTDYYKAWLGLMNQATKETDVSQISLNREAQHRYLTWRAQKDPGYNLLKRLIGETLAEDVVKKFLFNGVNELGNKTFLDYFPEYERGDGSINEKRSVVGKSFENRPWDAQGVFIGDTFG
ncbi:putative phytochromobilin:ferredoxin oxidoreductase [Helianthus annuus]|uniref:Phytochromobilin:ferredoxin oxidoreductase n=1 Tax=Helianthus annuus TaxID=4232 RepID=A0A251VCC7_HELAN|nr:phytochromobilin:ferredoxin oxidoreductase, chloroplastic [Helianthus annuus]KAF5816410.1 putative phytochromobilin:ferredoxin oxidoreductase [Helianthus annuus]KAJ0609751.1 putative phytochromobilin:ferredoxin oxidoreductase [Helianthus annuus]KAJ0769792.1 putative phytochromobilin:ferredoxin oxidoreductase [Helianthus annuus]